MSRPTRRRGAVRAARVVAAVAAIVASVWWAPPSAADDVTVDFGCGAQASASPTPTASPDAGGEPDRRCTPEEGDRIDDRWTISFTARAGTFSRLRRVRLYVLSEDEEIPSPGEEPNGSVPPVAVWGDAGSQANWTSIAQAPSSATLTYDWDTRALTPYNGRYTIRVEAWSHSDSSTEQTRAERGGIAVDNKPVRLGAPTASVSGRSIAVSWSPAREPDVVSYVVWRARTPSPADRPSSSEFVVVADDVVAPSYVDEDARSTHWYRVQAVRRSVVSQDGVIASDVSATSQAVSVAATPSPSTPPPVAPRSTPFVTSRPVASSPPRRPLAVVSSRPPPVPDAPFSAVLPYEDAPEGEEPAPPEEAGGPQAILDDGVEEGTPARTALLPVAIGAFLVSAALSLGRSPV